MAALDKGIVAAIRISAPRRWSSRWALTWRRTIRWPPSTSTPSGFAEMARRLAALNLPTVLVQEGGYLGPSLADNAKSFLTTFREATA